jgi:hypothetical protein
MANEPAKPANSKSAKAQTMSVSSISPRNPAESKPEGSSKSASLLKSSSSPVTAETRRLMIAEAAYYIAERRGFSAGREVEDWLLAEQQMNEAQAA